MSRIVDADVVRENIEEWLDTVGTALIGKGLSYTGELMGCIEDAPTVEAEPVVYCKDCAKRGTVACAFDGLYFKLCKDTDFCSKGKRRTENA